MQLPLQHEDFLASLRTISHETGLRLPDLPARALDLTWTGIFAFFREIFVESKHVWDDLPDQMRRLAAICKACLPGCDVAGSALPKSGVLPSDIGHWIGSALANFPEPQEIKDIVAVRLNGQHLRSFQEQAAHTCTRVSLLRAGCGTGKTLAAYQWAATRCPHKRLYICYPTTGTATEGFRDYVFDADAGSARGGARLFHSRAEIDLELILGVGDEVGE
jgi:CRISPR-associated endonuclease/helicase Cas3